MAESGFGAVATVLSLVATGFSGYAAYTSQQSQQDLAKAQQALSENTAARDYEIRVFDQVVGAIEKRNPDQLTAAKILTDTLPEDDGKTLKPSLQNLLQTVGQDMASTGEEVPQALIDLKKEASAQRGDEIAAAPATAGGAPVGRRVMVRDLVARPNPKGWDIDVFYCEEGGDQIAAANKASANAAADRLGKASTGQEKLGAGDLLGQIRVRPLTKEANDRNGYQLKTNAVYAGAGETDVADAVSKMLGASSVAAPTVVRSGVRSPWYLSMFYCQAAR